MKIEVHPRGSECGNNRGPTSLGLTLLRVREARDEPPRSAREFRQPSGARDDRSRVRERLRFSRFHREHRALSFGTRQAIEDLWGFTFREYHYHDMRSTTSSLFVMAVKHRSRYFYYGKIQRADSLSLSLRHRPNPRNLSIEHTRAFAPKSSTSSLFSPGNRLNDVPERRESFRDTLWVKWVRYLSRHSEKDEYHSTHLQHRSKSPERVHRADSTTPRDAATVSLTRRGRFSSSRTDKRTRQGTNRSTFIIGRTTRDTIRPASSECASRALSPLRLRSRDWECGEREAPSDFRGIHRYPYRRGGRCPCLQPACSASPAAPIPPPVTAPLLTRAPLVHPSSYPLTPAPKPVAERRTTPPWALLRDPCTSYIPPLSNRDRANHVSRECLLYLRLLLKNIWCPPRDCNIEKVAKYSPK